MEQALEFVYRNNVQAVAFSKGLLFAPPERKPAGRAFFTTQPVSLAVVFLGLGTHHYTSESVACGTPTCLRSWWCPRYLIALTIEGALQSGGFLVTFAPNAYVTHTSTPAFSVKGELKSHEVVTALRQYDTHTYTHAKQCNY